MGINAQKCCWKQGQKNRIIHTAAPNVYLMYITFLTIVYKNNSVL